MEKDNRNKWRILAIVFIILFILAVLAMLFFMKMFQTSNDSMHDLACERDCIYYGFNKSGIDAEDNNCYCTESLQEDGPFGIVIDKKGERIRAINEKKW